MADRHINTSFVPANDDHKLFREERHNFVPCTTVNIGDEPQLIRLHNLITSCSESCREISHMLAVVGVSGNPTTERKRGLVRREAIQVVKQRLLLWSATIFEYKDLSLLILVQSHAIQTLATIKSVLYEISETCRHGIQTLGWDNYSEKFTKDLLPLVSSLYSNLPGTWRDTIEWALTATLIKTTASTMIKEKIKLNDNDRIFIESLGSPKIEQSFIYMLDLIDEDKDTSPAPFLTPDNLVPSGSYDGIGVYSQKSDIDGPLVDGLISIRTGWTMEQAKMDLGDMEYIKTKYQQRLRLPKPDEMRVLVLGGYSENSTTGRVELLYRFPYWASQRSPPVSLRRLIAEKQLPDDTEVRFSIARKLICAILYFHACRWIHGNIDDRNIIFFEDSEHNLNFKEPFFCEFIPSSKDGLKAVPTTKESADVIFGNDVKLRNADTKRLWRTVLLVIFEKETVTPSGPPDSCLGYHDLSKWAEIDDCVYVSDWSSDKGVGRSTLEGNFGNNDDYISSQGMYSKLTRMLNLCSPMPTKYSRDFNTHRTYTGTWPAIPRLGLEGYEKAQSLKAVESREDKEGTDKQSKSMGGLSDTDIDLPGELEKQEIRSEVFPVMATQEQITQWQKEILPRLERILEKHLPAEESVSIDLLGIGTSREKSRPTIVVTCKSSRSVKLHLKRFPYDRTVFGLKVRKGSVQRSSGGSGRIADQYSRHQEKPLPGASIGACLNGDPLPAATYGGLILVDNKPYGLTVHHLVDPNEQMDGGGTDVEAGQLTGARGPHRHGEIVNRCLYSESEASTSDVEFEPDDDPSMESQGNMWGSLVCEPDDETFNDTEIQDISEPNGDIPGLVLNHNKRIVVVQPAAMDLLDQEWSECESITEDYYLGTILASSGIKRVIFESEKHEVDWALIEISSDRLGQRNLIQGGGKFLTSHTYDDEDSEPCFYVSTNEFSNLAVHGIGRTSGLQEGRISGAISAIRIHGRKTFSRSWGVTGEIGVGGDSGAWVIDNRHGGVCGHIIASKNDDDDKVKIAYINPMELLLRDIKKTLKAESVCLPTAAVAAQIGYMVESRLTECEGSSAVNIRPINPTLSTGGSDDVSSLASLPSS